MAASQNSGPSDVCLRRSSKGFPQLEHCSLRVVMRRLPSNLTEEEFLQLVNPLPPHRDFMHYSFARVYLTFNNIEDMIAFRDIFNGYVFVDSKGAESMALIELAPNQLIFAGKEEDGPLCGTIENDPDYLAFINRMSKAEATVNPTVDSILEEIDAREKAKLEPWNYMEKPPLAAYYDSILLEKKRFKEAKRKQREDERKKKEAERQRRLEKIKKEREAAKKAAAEWRNTDSGKAKAAVKAETKTVDVRKAKGGKKVDTKVETRSGAPLREHSATSSVYVPPHRKKGRGGASVRFKNKWATSMNSANNSTPECECKSEGTNFYQCDLKPESLVQSTLRKPVAKTSIGSTSGSADNGKTTTHSNNFETTHNSPSQVSTRTANTDSASSFDDA